MTLNLLSNDDSAPSVRQPTFTIDFGAGGGGGGLLSAVGLGQTAEDPWARSLVAMTVEIGLAPFVDIARLDIAADDQAPTVALDDNGSISLGYSDSSTDLVLTATVNALDYSLRGSTRVGAGNGGALLARMRVNQSYEQQSAGAIVSDLASSAAVDTDVVEDGVEFPFIVLDDRSTAYQHIVTLANKSGFVAYFTTEGKLYFGPFNEGQPVQTFTYGSDIISLQVRSVSPIVGSAKIVGQGAAGSEGQDAWSWLVKDPSSVTGEAGDGSQERLVSDATLRSSEASQAAADSIAAAGQLTAVRGFIQVPGAPQVVVGSTIEISGAPQEAANGTALVSWVSHRYDKRRGFTSVLEFNKSVGGAAGGLGGLL